MRRHLPVLSAIVALASACSVQGLSDETGWTPVQEPVPDLSSGAASDDPQSLGSRFLIAAERNTALSPNDAASPDDDASLPAVGDSGVTLASDGCGVTLHSLRLEVRPVVGSREAHSPAVRLSSTGPVVGRVLDSSPQSLYAVFTATLRAEPPAGQTPDTAAPQQVTVTVDAVEVVDGILTTVRVDLGDGSLSRLTGGANLEFTAWGAFAADEGQVPAHRWQCW